MSTAPVPERIIARTESEAQTIALGTAIADVVAPGDIVAIDGELGAGKTRLVRGIAMGFGVSAGEVRSPTFALAHEYTVGPGRPRLVHVDAYRLGGGEDLESIGWDRLAVPDAVVVVEWAGRIADALPTDRIRVRIDHAGEQVRDIVIEMPPGRTARAVRGFAASLPAAPKVHRCRTCGAEIATELESFPFCSDRCRLADLGNWLSERYRISRPVDQRDLDEG